MVSLELVNDGKNKDKQGSQCQTTSEKTGYMVVSGKFSHRMTVSRDEEPFDASTHRVEDAP